MILGKRHRPPIKRTTSMTEFTIDLHHTTTNTTCNNNNNNNNNDNPFNMDSPSVDDRHRFLTATVSPRNHRRNSADYMQSDPHFLTVCGLCKRRLIPGKDIFMYRGDSAFCSLECRQEQMKQDEKKDKRSLIPKKPIFVDSECSSNPSKKD
ncbi:hypothetical protein QVD17_38378 [Tagetes erecta]|uniref:FLZ-type domain-containing protein n=1 Tax=Tagetes erecta TaxID=13708 RepID=A0AAD8N9A9_TARER|nr:hypothetical protein QVD17_38378 [Tagetes erecta]